jgi:hypothetical protein
MFHLTIRFVSIKLREISGFRRCIFEAFALLDVMLRRMVVCYRNVGKKNYQPTPSNVPEEGMPR